MNRLMRFIAAGLVIGTGIGIMEIAVDALLREPESNLSDAAIADDTPTKG